MATMCTALSAPACAGREVVGAVDDDLGPVTRPPSTRAATVVLTAGMLLAAAALFLLVVQLPTPGVARGLPWWVLIPFFVLGERFVVNLRVGRSAFSCSFGHVPLAVGLCMLPPVQVVAAGIVGAVGTQLLYLRQRGVKLGFNAGLWSLDATLAASVYGLLADGARGDGARSLAGVLVAIVVTNQVTALAISAVIAIHEGFDAVSWRQAMTWPLAIAVGNTSVAVLAVVLVEHDLAALPFLAVLLIVLLIAHRAYEQLHDAHAWQERHHGAAQSLARAQGSAAVRTTVLAQARELLEVEHAELHLGAHADGCPDVRVEPVGPPVASTDWWLRLTSDHAGPVLLARDSPDPGWRRVLRAGSVSEAAVAPLSVAGQPGVLVVADRLGEVSALDRGDLRTLETLASQAGVALANANLLDRVREEASDRAYEARHDALTGLPNRRGFLEALDAALAAQARAGVVLLDLDRFKEVNDALGHVVGDEVIVEVARRLVGVARGDAVVARLGGDEYALLVADAAVPRAVVEVAVAAAGALAEPLLTHGMEIQLDASLGSATAPVDGRDATALLQRADIAMYRAKETRSGYEAYEASLDGSSAERLALFGELRRAVRGGQLDVHFQPSVHLRTGAVVSAEALVRWNHPVRGLVPPDAFIPLAERSGLITELTDVVLRRAFTELARWRADGLLQRVAVNLSPRVLLDGDLPGRVELMLAAAGLPASAVTLEVTESAVMSDPERALAVLEALRAIGLHLSVDDYGTGYSSLAYLTRLPVDEVKIDRTFVTGLASGAGLAAEAIVVRSTVEMAHALGLSVVAEGVEDGATLDLLAGWGCDSAQGYFMSRPLPVERLDRWLLERSATVAHGGRHVTRSG